MALPHSCPISLTTNGLIDIFFSFLTKQIGKKLQAVEKHLEQIILWCNKSWICHLNTFAAGRVCFHRWVWKRSGCLLQISSRKWILPGSSQTFSLDSPQPHPILSWSKCPSCAWSPSLSMVSITVRIMRRCFTNEVRVREVETVFHLG